MSVNLTITARNDSGVLTVNGVTLKDGASPARNIGAIFNGVVLGNGDAIQFNWTLNPIVWFNEPTVQQEPSVAAPAYADTPALCDVLRRQRRHV